MYTADDLDDIVHDRFGGKRYTDADDGVPRPGPRRGDRRREGVRAPRGGGPAPAAGLLEVLDAAAPPEITRPAVRALLAPRGGDGRAGRARPHRGAAGEGHGQGRREGALRRARARAPWASGPRPDATTGASDRHGDQAAPERAAAAPDAKPATSKADAVRRSAQLDCRARDCQRPQALPIAVQRINAQRKARACPR